MKLKYIYFILSLIFGITTKAQNPIVTGTITDAKTGESLIGANVFLPKKNIGTISNEYGFFNIPLPKDSVAISFSYIGYETRRMTFYLASDTILNV